MPGIPKWVAAGGGWGGGSGLAAGPPKPQLACGSARQRRSSPGGPCSFRVGLATPGAVLPSCRPCHTTPAGPCSGSWRAELTRAASFPASPTESCPGAAVPWGGEDSPALGWTRPQITQVSLLSPQPASLSGWMLALDGQLQKCLEEG